MIDVKELWDERNQLLKDKEMLLLEIAILRGDNEYLQLRLQKEMESKPNEMCRMP